MNTVNYEVAVKAAIRSRSLEDIQRGIHASMELQRDWNARRLQARKSESQVMLKSILLAMRSNMERIQYLRRKMEVANA
ncbi:hypothetical protein [Aliidiomarina quisquiliarum]|uniref:hypothetical protein n=1 Tax=Aliidiomarina quisquiliarum TaxID=2938947 RepID=UPI00208FC9F8|nr:hypothetical protein [Aliidiomarina quisquiliarum]MCO4320018.1 hypothetical protein [Aliidiomarina quisquiliarum]